MKRVVAINVAVLCLLVLGVEALGQMYYRWAYGALPAELYGRTLQTNVTVFEPHPYLVAWPKSGISISQNGATISTTALHTRVTGASAPAPDAIGVAVVGGSTTFGTRVTDADSWPWLLQERLGSRYSVINYGVPGYSTAENIIQMALLVPEQQPRIAVFFEGWNDLRSYHWPGFSADYYHHGMSQFDTLIPRTANRSTFLTRAARWSYVIGLIGRLLGEPVGAQTLSAGDAARAPSNQPDPEVDRVFVRNLGTLRALALHFGMTALFVPQVLNEENYSKKGVSRSWTPYIEDAAVPMLMHRFNGLMAGVCPGDDARCQFVGEVLTQHWDGNDFVDEGHLSRRGGEKLAALLGARISRLK